MLFQVMYLILDFSAAQSTHTHTLTQPTYTRETQAQPIHTLTNAHTRPNPASPHDVHAGIRCNPSSYFQQICPTGELCRNDGSLTCGKDVYHNVAYCLCPPYDHDLHGSRPVKCNLNFPQVCPTGHLCSPKILRCDNLGSCTCPQFRDFHIHEDVVDDNTHSDHHDHHDDDYPYDKYAHEFFDDTDNSVIFDPENNYNYFYDQDGQLHYTDDLDDHLYRYDDDNHNDYDYIFDDHETDHHETDHHETDHYETDHHETDHHETDHHETDHHETDHHETDHHETDHHETDHHETDHHETDHRSSHHCIPNADFVSLCPSGHECRSDLLPCTIDSYFNVDYCECPLEPVTNVKPGDAQNPQHQQHHEVHCDPNSVATQVCPSGHLCSPDLHCVKHQKIPISPSQEVHCNPYQNQICPNGVPCNRHHLDCEYSLDGNSLIYCNCPVSNSGFIQPSSSGAHPNLDYCICPNVKSQQTHVPSQQTYIPSQQTHVPSQQIHVPSQHAHVPSQQIHVPSQDAQTSSHHIHNQVEDMFNPHLHYYPEHVIVDPHDPEHAIPILEDLIIEDLFPEDSSEEQKNTCGFGNCDAGDSVFRDYLKNIRLSQTHVSSTNLHVLRATFMSVYKVGCGCDPSCVHFKDCCADYAIFCEQP